MLGDVVNDDGSYTGEDGGSVFSLQFYRNKASEFQAVMNALDLAAQSLRESLQTVMFDDDGVADEIQILLADLDARRGHISAAAQAVNLASDAANAVGVRFPSLTVPQGLAGLGMAPIPIAIIAGAIAAASVLIVWGREYLVTQRALQLRAQQYAQIREDPAAVAALTLQLAKTDAAIQMADNPLGQVANIVKWAALAVLGYLAFQAYQKRIA